MEPRNVEEPGSFLEQARRDRERLTKPRSEVFELPGFTNIAVRYGVLSYAKSRELVQESLQHGADADADLWVAAESLQEMCQTFVYRDSPDGEWKPWSHNGKPVRYDETLIEQLGITPMPDPKPRDAVYGLFGGLPQADRPLMTHYFEVLNWVDTFESEASEQSVGKSVSGGSST